MALSQLSCGTSLHSPTHLHLRTQSHSEASCSRLQGSISQDCGGSPYLRNSCVPPSRVSQRASFPQRQCGSSVSPREAPLGRKAPRILSNSFLSNESSARSSDTCTAFIATSRSSLSSFSPQKYPHQPPGRHSHPSRISASASTTLPTIALKNYSPEPFVRLGECLVLTPLAANPVIANPSPRGVIAFFGGAFVGAVPAFTYRFLLTQLAAAGYLVVAVPYQLTFDHQQSADVIERRLQDCLELLYAQEGYGIGSIQGLRGSELKKLPVFGVGHSNGALLHMLTNSLYTSGVRPKANVIMSFNNKPASEAIPYFDQVGPAVAQLAPALKGSPLQGLAEAFASQAARLAVSTELPIPGLPTENLGPLIEIAEQIAPVIGQITDGVSEFRPAPHETRGIAAGGYYVPSTLLVKFTDDSIDETESLAAAIRTGVQSRGGSLRIQDLTGNHVTPLIQEVKWEVGSVYTPLDAVRQTVQTLALADTRRLVSAIVSFLNSNS